MSDTGHRRVRAIAPIRVADLGGWTDTWFAGHGAVCNVAVQPGVEVVVTTAPGGEVVIDAVDFGDRYDLSEGRGRHPLLEAAVDEVGLPPGAGATITVHSPIPPGASTGTSAAVTVALVAALTALRRDGTESPPANAAEIAATAHRVEAERLRRQTGIQDQLSSAYGGINLITMRAYPEAEVTPVVLPASVARELESRLLLVFLGRTHVSSTVHEHVIAELERGGPEAMARLDPLRAAALAGHAALLAGDLEAYGRILSANTQAQEALHPGLVSDDARIVIEVARAHGAGGWKVNGAGGEGGSMTLLAGPAPGAKSILIDALHSANARFVCIATSLDVAGVAVRVEPVVALGNGAGGGGRSSTMSNADPHKEPENSTVEDWMGQEVNKDMDLADKVVEESGGDMAEAEKKFNEQSAGAEPDAENVPRANGEGHS